MPNKWEVLINQWGGVLINNGRLLKIKVYKNTKAFVYGYVYSFIVKYALYFIYRGIPQELGVPKIRREFPRDHLCEIVIQMSIF